MIRYALPPILMAGPLFAHGVHAPVAPAWHGLAHLAVSAGLAVLAAAVGVAVFRGVRGRADRGRRERRGR